MVNRKVSGTLVGNYCLSLVGIGYFRIGNLECCHGKFLRNRINKRLP